jgi:hypothetical protein
MGEDARPDFDTELAWMRRFEADATGNLRALALRLKEALPQKVNLETRGGFFGRGGAIVGVTVELGDYAYALKLDKGQLRASVSMIVRGVAISNKPVAPEEWFRRLAEDARASSQQARGLSQSIDAFMSS